MSTLLGASSGLRQYLYPNDDAASPPALRYNDNGRRADRVWQEGLNWSGSKFTGGGGGFALQQDALCGIWGVDDADEAGSASRKKIIGLTRDSVGAILGSVTVQGFLTATDGYVGEVVSDAGGYYVLPTSFTAAHYLVAYKAGGTDLAGTTVNTLIPV